MPTKQKPQTEEQELADQEQREETTKADGPDVQPTVTVGGKPVGELSKEEILELLNKRRAEYGEVQKVAKEKGVAAPKLGKATRADADRLMEFFNRVGYQTGMRQWATGRRAEVLGRIGPVVQALGEGWDPEKHGEAVSAMVEGFREARIQTSFKSTSMPEKKLADKVPEDVVWKELQPLIQGLADFLDELLDGPTVEGDQPVDA